MVHEAFGGSFRCGRPFVVNKSFRQQAAHDCKASLKVRRYVAKSAPTAKGSSVNHAVMGLGWVLDQAS